jgi:hypothetical protein
MAKMLERDLEQRVIRYAKGKGCLCYKFSSPSHRGVADRIIIAPGGAVGFLELKREGEEPTALQWKFLNEARKQGAFTGWADTLDKAKEFINALTL